MAITDTKSTGSFNDLRNAAVALIRTKSNEITALAEHIEQLDAALICGAERNVDELMALIGAAQRLSTLIDCEAGR